jgi:hypothetical protein
LDFAQTAENVAAYIGKQLLRTYPPVYEAHLPPAIASSMSRETELVNVVGYFSDPGVTEGDEYEDFLEYCADHVRLHPTMHASVVITSPPYPYDIPRSPAAVILPGERYVLLDEGEALNDFVRSNSLPLVSFLTPASFSLLSAQRKPMVMLFVDYRRDSTGGVANTDLQSELAAVAKDLSRNFVFTVADGLEHLDRMRLLGIEGGTNSLPALAINGVDRRTAIFPEESPMNRDTITVWLGAFLNGNNEYNALVESAGRKNRRNAVSRERRETSQHLQEGVSEKLTSEVDVKYHIVNLTPENFNDVALWSSKDVLILFHRGVGCPACDNLAVFYTGNLGASSAGLRVQGTILDTRVVVAIIGWRKAAGSRRRRLRRI